MGNFVINVTWAFILFPLASKISLQLFCNEILLKTMILLR